MANGSKKDEAYLSSPIMMTEAIENIIRQWQGELVKPTAEISPPECRMVEEDTFGLLTNEEGRPPIMSEMTKRYPDFAKILCWLPKTRDKGEEKSKKQEAIVATSIDILGAQQNKRQKKRQENTPAAIMEIKTISDKGKEGAVVVWPPIRAC